MSITIQEAKEIYRTGRPIMVTADWEENNCAGKLGIIYKLQPDNARAVKVRFDRAQKLYSYDWWIPLKLISLKLNHDESFINLE